MDLSINAEHFMNKRCIVMYNIFIEWCNNNGYNKLMSMFTFKEDICSLYDMEIDICHENNQHFQSFTKRGKNINLTVKPF